jgi:phosphoribosylglycinamide formyltransferase-1
MKKIVFLVSGGGGTLKFIYNAICLLNLPIEIIGIIADRKVNINEFADENNIFFTQIKYNKDYSKELQDSLIALNPDLIITNIHKIIDSKTLKMFNHRFINLHYSLLPSYAGYIGMETVKMAELQNVGFIGGTCHEVNEVVDAGKIIHQGCFKVDWKNDLHIIDTVFKTSSILLLGGICSKLELNLGYTEKLIINKNEVIFSPKLPLDNLDFSKPFWEVLK